MSDIHVIAGDGLHKWTILFHYPVPSENNAVGVSYETALINSGLAKSSMAPGTGAGQISTAELALVVGGKLYEYNLSFRAESGATNNSEMIASVREQYTRHEQVAIDEVKHRLKYYGYAGDMP